MKEKIHESFYDWCIKNNHCDYLELWDYELNNCTPNDITYGTKNKYYFKCKEGKHQSHLVQIMFLTTNKGKLVCKACNSIGNYIDTCLNGRYEIDKDYIDIAYNSSRCSKEKIKVICKNCGTEITKTANQIHANKNVCNCSKGISYPEKIICFVLEYLNIVYEKEKYFDWSCLDSDIKKRKRYDFYLPKYNCIIEVHGSQHYQNTFSTIGGRTLEEEQANDTLKEKLAKENGIEHYIILDCRKSELDFIKNNILKSNLPSILKFNDNDINWDDINKYIYKNKIKIVCELWNETYNSVEEFVKDNDFDECVATIRKYLKIGAVCNYCNYDAKKNIVENGKRKTNTHAKKVSVYKGDVKIKDFESILDVERCSLETLGVFLHNAKISYCLKNNKKYKGFHFELRK